MSPTDLLRVSSSSFLLFPNELQGTFDNGPLPTEVIFDLREIRIGSNEFITGGVDIYTLKGGDPDMPTFNTGTYDGVLEYKGGVPLGEGTLTITDVGTIGPDSPTTPTLSHRLSRCSAPASSAWPEQRAAAFLATGKDEESKRGRSLCEVAFPEVQVYKS